MFSDGVVRGAGLEEASPRDVILSLRGVVRGDKAESERGGNLHPFS